MRRLALARAASIPIARAEVPATDGRDAVTVVLAHPISYRWHPGVSERHLSRSEVRNS